MTNAELIDALRTDIREVEDDSVKTLSLMWRAADALEAAEKRIVELEAQLAGSKDAIRILKHNLEMKKPKDGEWIDMGDFEMCSVCKIAQRKKYRQYNDGFMWVREDFCPKCGARCKQ